MKSKESRLLELFFNYPTKEWHFEELVKKTKMSRSKIHSWLQKFLKGNLITRIKENGRMPYYLSNHQLPEYQNRKRIFALNQLYDSGLLNHLSQLRKADTIIVFGSYARSDWYQESDIDLFIYGDTEGLALSRYERTLKREIQLFSCKDAADFKRYGTGLIRNIIKGNLIKGNLEFLEVHVRGEIS